ncbi:aspartate--ammonia ligase [Lederbergia graminis]|uniref:Aspartate--ammonia ligase n=1 Tax=Lederbergia graminis TaxID=735518 RepID=A0ABW0LEQ1_9BACI
MNNPIFTPKQYKSKLDVMETEIAIKKIKDCFENCFAEVLHVTKISAPMILKQGKGLNDNLNGVERTVSFDALDLDNSTVEIVQSLAKWKRVALARYGFSENEGIYTDMRAIRRDEILDNLHSLYVDQWDWEKVIAKDQRNLYTLKTEVLKIYDVMKATESFIKKLYPVLTPMLPEEINFITTKELEALYPHYSPKEREDIIAKKYGAVFIMQIGGELPSGQKHDGRSPDYDDWELNGDMIFWYPVLEKAIEISSMGIRVDESSLLYQLKAARKESRKSLEYHQLVLDGRLPYTIGGGIGQSRLCMFLLGKSHIGEVQSSVWDDQVIKDCKKNNIHLL